MKIKRFLALIGIHIFIIMLICNCTPIRYVDTNPALTLKKDLREVSSSIVSVEIYYITPSVSIDIETNEEISDTVSELVLTEVKEFSTLENLDQIAYKYGWKDHINSVTLRIYPNHSHTHYYVYSARYFIINDDTNTSESNIDAYQTWNMEIVDLSTDNN